MKGYSEYDAVIVGGGIAGLSLSLLLARKGWRIALLEKGRYPRKKVCGEFISMESYPFLEHLGISPEVMSQAHISRFRLTTHTGKQASCNLRPGGFGISRYFLDGELARLAEASGVQLLTNTKVTKIIPPETSAERYVIRTSDGKEFKCRLAVGSFGRAGSPKPLNTMASAGKNKNYIGIKYHVDINFPTDLIEIHGFKGGYGGISGVENGRYCFCYMIQAEILKHFDGNIEAMEEQWLSANPFLKSRLENLRKTESPVTASQFVFGSRQAVDENILLTGDASGFIPPLTGNGMSLAFRSSAIVAPLIDRYFSGLLSKTELYRLYKREHNRQISRRIRKGVWLQSMFLNHRQGLQSLVMEGFSRVPGMLYLASRQAFGKTI